MGHIAAVKKSGVPVVWQCDGVHGNGIVAKSNKYKTRNFDDIVAEISQCIAIHKRCGSVLGGIHVEATGQETVTECIGGCVGITEEGLPVNYETYCDPRLNYAQSIEAIFKVQGIGRITQQACEEERIDSAAFDFAWQGVRGVDRYGFLICFQSQIRVFDGG